MADWGTSTSVSGRLPAPGRAEAWESVQESNRGKGQFRACTGGRGGEAMKSRR
jgi:hypothetical protein